MTTLNTRDLSVNEIHRILGFQRQYNESFTPLLSLEKLTEFDEQEITQIRTDFDNYLIPGKVYEGLV